MSLNRWAKNRDENEPAIVDALRAAGASVFRLDKPLDLLVGYRGKNLLLEVKLPPGPDGGTAHSPLKPGQKEFLRTWRGHSAVVRTVRDALEAIGARTTRTGGDDARPKA